MTDSYEPWPRIKLWPIENEMNPNGIQQKENKRTSSIDFLEKQPQNIKKHC